MKIKALVLSMFAVVFSVGANAAEVSNSTQMHELLLNGTQGAFGFGSNQATTFSVRGGYNYTLVPGIQVGISPEFAWIKPSTGASTTSLAFLAGPTFNWPMEDKLDDAFFLFIGAGVRAVTGSTDFQFGGEVGKRIKLMEGFTYRPSFSLRKVSGTDMSFAVNVLSFSAVF